MRWLFAADTAELDEAAQAFGLYLVEDDAEKECELWPENAPVIDCLPLLVNAWRYAPMGQRIGYDWPQVRKILRMNGIKRKAMQALLPGLRVVERVILQELKT